MHTTMITHTNSQLAAEVTVHLGSHLPVGTEVTNSKSI